MASVIPPAETLFTDASGRPLVGGKVFHYIPNTLIPKVTYADPTGTLPNSNPVILDGDGRALIYGSGLYRQIVRDSLDNLIWDRTTGVSDGTPSPGSFQTGNTTVTPGQTVVTVPFQYGAGTNSLLVYINGVYQAGGYAETNNTTVTFDEGLPGGVVSFQGLAAIGIGTADSSNVSFTQAGTGVMARSVQSKLRDVINVNDFLGVDPTGSIDSLAGIQAAENYCNSLGRPVELHFSGKYVTSASINKRANVHWRGAGSIRRIDNLAPSGALFALVLANAVNDWSIIGLTFENVSNDVFAALFGTPGQLTYSFAPGNESTCIDAYHCENFTIERNTMRKFRQGVLYRGCKKCRIINNSLFSDCGKTVAQILAGTFTQFLSGGGAALYPQTGGITVEYLNTGPDADYPTEFLISGNYINVPGLDCAIQGVNQNYDVQPGTITNNVIAGCNVGIQLYRGSFSIPPFGGSQIYRTDEIVHDNFIYATWEQGIYLRGMTGVSVQNNILIRCAQNAGGASGTSGGSIVTRVNPRVVIPNNTIDSEYPVTHICGNTIIEHGRDNVVNDGALHVRLPNCIVRNNTIVRQLNTFPTSLGPGILVDRGEGITRAIVEDNYIYNFADGILWDSAARNQVVSVDSGFAFRRNTITRCSTAGMNLAGLWHRGATIEWNVFSACTTGLRLGNLPYTTVRQNKFNDCTTGFLLNQGTLASDYVTRKYGASAPTSAISAGGRIGATLKVFDNEFTNCTTPHSVGQVAVGDDSFAGRCAKWDGDLVDGALVRSNDYASAAPPTSRPKQWDRGDIVYNTTIAGGTVYARICSVAGQYKANAATINTTGDTTSGNRMVTNVGAVGGIGPGQYLSIGGSVFRVQEVTYDPNTVLLETAPGATAAGVAITAAPDPTFINLYNAGST